MSTVLVISDADVREVLEMESCIAAMEDALARDGQVLLFLTGAGRLSVDRLLCRNKG